MSQLALSLIEECIRTQNPYLDLGCCGLTDAFVAEGTAIDIALRQCTHLKTLILSNQWLVWDKKHLRNERSKNMGKNNFFSICPSAIMTLKNLSVLHLGGEKEQNWEITNISFVSEMLDMRTLDICNNKIRKIKHLDKLTALRNLYINNNQIKELQGLENLSSLRNLYISDNQITELKGLDTLANLLHLEIKSNLVIHLKGLNKLTKLEHLDVEDNKIEEIEELEELVNLKYLNINHNKISELKGLNRLLNLKYLHIKNNQINELKGLYTLKNLTVFNISFNKINQLKALDTLISLEIFDIQGNQIDELKGLETLINLKTFIISHNKINELKGLETLINLEMFDIQDNQIDELKGLETLKKLQAFYISHNEISELNNLDTLINLSIFHIAGNEVSEIKELENLKNLKTFDISYNKLNKLSISESLLHLQKFAIEGNQITSIRPLLPLLQRIEQPIKVILSEWEFFVNGTITVKHNPLTNPPIEIVQQGNQAILDWFEANKDTFKEVKVLLIGDAKAGKTSLLRRLKEDIYREGEEQTDGIIIEKFTFKDLATFADYPTLHEATAYFWDFGGQETMSATHQFFMTRRSVYLLLLEARKDKKADEQLRELMEQVQAFGGNSQVIVVVNKIDLNTGFGLDSPTLLQDYPQIKHILYISCKEDLNIDKVKQALSDCIPQAELYETEIDERWKAIKEVLQTQTDTQHYLPENSFLSICDTHKLTERRQQDNAISFLHDLGILLHFEQLDLSEYYVLEPYWVTTGVYQILTSPFAGDEDGKIPVEKLKFIINEEEGKKNAYCPTKKIHYSSNEVRFIADIMTQFKLAYYTTDRQTLLIPDLFENETPLRLTNAYTETADCLRFVYEYSYLPKSILPRFMVEMQIDIQTAWRTGAILQSKQNLLSSALVVVREKQIHIYVKGEHKQKREYLSVIRFFLDKINESLNLKPTLKIPLPKYEKHYAKYAHLLTLEKRGTQEYEDLDLEKEFLVSQLLEGIERRDVIERQGNTIIYNYNYNLPPQKPIPPQNPETEALLIFKQSLHQILDNRGFEGVNEVLRQIEQSAFLYDKAKVADFRTQMTESLTQLASSHFVVGIRAFIAGL